MSADNGIYILRTPNVDFNDYEYRVSEAQAIENIYYNVKEPLDAIPDDVVMIFDKGFVFTREEAIKEAFRIYDEIQESDYPIVEHGIQEIHLNFPFSRYQELTEELKNENKND